MTSRTDGPRLLIVDDSVPVRRLVGELAAELGYQVVGEAGDGVAGAAAAVRLEPDVVVMDWQMPELDGVRATAVIRERRPSIEVIAFSSADDDVIAHAFRRAGAGAYVEKADVDGLVEELKRRHPATREHPDRVTVRDDDADAAHTG